MVNLRYSANNYVTVTYVKSVRFIHYKLFIQLVYPTIEPLSCNYLVVLN